ncbi:hypothetical protein ACWEKT_29355 [Nocardia takedensis]
MNTNPSRVLVLAVTALLSAGCTGTTHTPATATPTSTRPPTSTVQDMCDTLATFFTDDLGVQDTHIRTVDDPGSPIYGQAVCSLETGSQSLAYASIARLDGTSTNPTPGPGMKPMSGTSQAAWLSDGRPHGLVEIITLGDDQQCVMQLQQQHAHTLGGPLVLTDTQLHDLAELCIGLTRYLRK